MQTIVVPAVDRNRTATRRSSATRSSTATRSSPATRSASERTREYLENSDKTFGDCRQRLIAYLVKLNHALDENFIDLSEALLGRFCDTLVDYLSAGHFRVFQRAIPSAHEYAAIEASTRQAMVFNDSFGNGGHFDRTAVKNALEALALTLGTRFELEDDILRNDHARDEIPDAAEGLLASLVRTPPSGQPSSTRGLH